MRIPECRFRRAQSAQRAFRLLRPLQTARSPLSFHANIFVRPDSSAHGLHAGSRLCARSGSPDSDRAGAGAIGRGADCGPFAAGSRAVRKAVRDLTGSPTPGTATARDHRSVGSQQVSDRAVHPQLQPTVYGKSGPGGLGFRNGAGSPIWTRSSPIRRRARSNRTTRSALATERFRSRRNPFRATCEIVSSELSFFSSWKEVDNEEVRASARS